jgi:predicted nucleic acid-binding protein
MNVVDSSAWLEYFSDGPNAGFFAKAIENSADLLVPALSIFEVFKRVMQQRGETAAVQAAALMNQGRVVPLDGTLAIHAARTSLALGLPLADSIMLATAHAFDAEFWTQDSDFRDVAGVHYCEAGRKRR